MGACVSVHKHPDSAMKLRLSFGSKTEKLVIPSPIKDKPIIVTGDSDRPISEVGLKSQWTPTDHHPVMTTFRHFGSRDEKFFDSQAWLDSDCDDDFLSVNGDFTPSRGSTPVHHNFSTGTPGRNKARFEVTTPSSLPEPSPTDKKKKLSELFQDSLRDNQDQDVDDQNSSCHRDEVNGKVEDKITILDIPPKSSNGTPFVSGANSVCSSERTPNGDVRAEKGKSVKSVQCCLPSLLSSRSFSERKKKTSPARSIG